MSELYQLNGNTYTLQDVEKIALNTVNSIEKIKAEYEKSYGIYERLERDTFDASNTESYENTVERLYNQGYSDALLMVIKQLEKGGN
jgi:hypothetical protein